MAISTAILAAPYAVCQTVSLPRTATPSPDSSRTLENAELVERAITVDEAASALGFLRDVYFCTSSAGDGGCAGGDINLRKLGIAMGMDGNGWQDQFDDWAEKEEDWQRGYGA